MKSDNKFRKMSHQQNGPYIIENTGSLRKDRRIVSLSQRFKSKEPLPTKTPRIDRVGTLEHYKKDEAYE